MPLSGSWPASPSVLPAALLVAASFDLDPEPPSPPGSARYTRGRNTPGVTAGEDALTAAGREDRGQEGNR
jgi:hypothetical protein